MGWGYFVKSPKCNVNKIVKVKKVDNMKNEMLRDLFTSFDDSVLITLWNEYCYECNMYDDEIFDNDTLEEMIKCSNEDGLYWINRFFYGSDDYTDNGSANPNRNYFKFDGYGNIVSFDYIYNQFSDTFNHIDIDDVIDYIIENDNDFNYPEIRDILDNEQ